MYRIGIIGTGVIAASHAEAALNVPGTKLACAADIDESKVLQFASKYDAKPYLDYKLMIDEEKPDMVIVNLPHFLHKDAVLYATEKHIHILLEKPMALNVEECEAMIKASTEKNVKLFVGHIQRYIDFNILLKETIETGSLGKLICINERQYTDYFNAERPKWFLRKDMAGGGIAFNLGAHFFDRIQWVTGSKVMKIHGKVNFSKDEYDVESATHIFCELDNGVSACCVLNGCSPVEEHTLEYIFTHGNVEIHPFNKMIIRDKTGVREIPIGQMDMFTKQLRDFMYCVQNDSKPEIGGDYGMNIISCIKMLHKYDK